MPHGTSSLPVEGMTKSSARHLTVLLLFFTLLLDMTAAIFSSLSTSMLTNSVESDFLYLRYSPLTTAVNSTHAGGVYAVATVCFMLVYCEAYLDWIVGVSV
jgi:hypothetical protein